MIKTKNGYIFSLMSSSYGGFLNCAEVTNIRHVRNNIYAGTVERNFKGEYEYDHDYEFFEEQYIDPINILVYSEHREKKYFKDDRVMVYARQIWKQTLETPIPGVVYQDQLGGSVIVSVSPDNIADPTINSTGGVTLEVYPYQLRYYSHTEDYPTFGSKDALYAIRSGFQRAKQFDKRPWYKRTISNLLRI